MCKRWNYLAKLSWQSFKKLKCEKNIIGGMKIDGLEEDLDSQIIIFQDLLERCGTHLTHLDLSGLGCCSDIFINIITAKCKNLKSINLGNHVVTNDTLEALSHIFYKVEDLTMHKLDLNINDNDLALLFLENKKLKRLTMGTTSTINGTFFEALPNTITELVFQNLIVLPPIEIYNVIKIIHMHYFFRCNIKIFYTNRLFF